MLTNKNIILYTALFLTVILANYLYYNLSKGPITIERSGDFTALGVSDATPIVAYTALWCDACKELKSYLASNKIEYKNIDIDEDKNAIEALENFGLYGVPVIIIKDNLIQGFNGDLLTKYIVYN